MAVVKPKSMHVQRTEHHSKKQVCQFMPAGELRQRVNADFSVCKLLFTSGTVIKYMSQGSDGSVEGLMQYSGEEVWYKLGRQSTHVDVGEIFYPEKEGYVVSSITKG